VTFFETQCIVIMLSA